MNSIHFELFCREALAFYSVFGIGMVYPFPKTRHFLREDTQPSDVSNFVSYGASSTRICETKPVFDRNHGGLEGAVHTGNFNVLPCARLEIGL